MPGDAAWLWPESPPSPSRAPSPVGPHRMEMTEIHETIKKERASRKVVGCGRRKAGKKNSGSHGAHSHGAGCTRRHGQNYTIPLAPLQPSGGGSGQWRRRWQRSDCRSERVCAGLMTLAGGALVAVAIWRERCHWPPASGGWGCTLRPDTVRPALVASLCSRRPHITHLAAFGALRTRLLPAKSPAPRAAALAVQRVLVSQPAGPPTPFPPTPRQSRRPTKSLRLLRSQPAHLRPSFSASLLLPPT